MQKLRQNLQILLHGIGSDVSEPIISMLRSARLAPRAESADDEKQLSQALNDNHWDLLLYHHSSSLPLDELGKILKNHSKDIPVIVLAPDASPEHRIEGLKQKASAVVPLDQTEMLVLTVRRELYHLENRRRRRMAEFHLTETEKRCRELLHSSSEGDRFSQSQR